MDTPERSKIGGTPLSKFEDSPVFNFINNLSPIQPVKSTHSVQTYQPLNFGSISSIFTSPHANPQKESKVTITQETSNKSPLNEASPNHNTVPHRSVKTELEPGKSARDEPIEKRKNLFASEVATEGGSSDRRAGSGADVAECDWEYLLSGSADDLLICDPSDENETGGGGGKELIDNDGVTGSFLLLNTQPSVTENQSQAGSGEQIQENFSEGGEGDDNQLCYKVDGQQQQQRGMRRRCLVFDPSISVASKCKINSENSFKPKKNPLTTLPGIGLHLNALATTSKDRLMNPGSTAQILSVQKSQVKSISVGKNLVSSSTSESQDTCLTDDENPLAIVPIDASESGQSSPKKKRRKAESGDGDACKRCSCKKSKCLKLYCECFAAGVYCSEPCACQSCLNKPIHEETVLSTRKQIEFRNPLAFAPKVIRTADTSVEIGEDSNNTPASARHKRGCNCKKSNCLKKYCECFQGGVGCSASCRCEGCKNSFGKREGLLLIGAEEFRQAGEDANTCEKEEEIPESGQESANVNNFDNHSAELIPITPPFEPSGTLLKLPYHSSAKPPRPSGVPSGFSSRIFNTSHSLLLKCNRSNKSSSDDGDNDTPDYLKTTSPGNVTKTSSPNGKRVSPPHCGTGSGIGIGTSISPSRKGGRKLILRSIPSFPSLTGDLYDECLGNNPGSNSFGPSAPT